MLDAALKDGTAHRRCTFELFGRRLPATRRFGVVAGTGRILEALERFEFDAEQIEWLHNQGIISEEAAQFLASWRFTGDIWGYAEGECYFSGSPLLTVEGTFADCTLLETLLLSVLNHDCAVASAASRMTIAAHGRPCMDMGARRAHERAAVSAARAAIIGGFQGTSDLEAAKRYGIRCIGTAAHAFTLLHDTERDAFDSQVAKLGAGTTLLVDTYDIRQGVINAVEAARAAGGELGAVRLDSGDLVAEAFKVRGQLDAMGATTTKITVTSDLDEYAIAALGAAPVDSYGVGTKLVTGSGVPTAALVYKVVQREDSRRQHRVGGQEGRVEVHCWRAQGCRPRHGRGRLRDRGTPPRGDLLRGGPGSAGRARCPPAAGAAGPRRPDRRRGLGLRGPHPRSRAPPARPQRAALPGVAPLRG